MLLPQLESLVRSGRYTEAAKVFLQILGDDAFTRRELAPAYHLASVAKFHMGEHHVAVNLARMAENMAIETGDDETLGRLWVNMVEFHRVTGDYHEAAACAEKWLQNKIMFQDGDGEGARRQLEAVEARVRYNLGLVYRSQRYVEKSLDQLQMAADRMQDRPRSFQAMVRQLVAWIWYEQNRPDKGDEQMHLAGDLIDSTDHESIREQLLLQCWKAYQAGRYQEMMVMAEEFTAPGGLTPTTTVQSFWATWMIGMAGVKVGEVEAARGMARIAMAYAMETTQPILMNRACELERQVQMMAPEDAAG